MRQNAAVKTEFITAINSNSPSAASTFQVYGGGLIIVSSVAISAICRRSGFKTGTL